MSNGGRTFRFRFRAALIIELAPSDRYRMLKNKTVRTPAFSIAQNMSKTQFANELRRVMSKIWRLLGSTHVVLRMLRYINWCLLFVVICATLPTVPISAVAAFPLLSANNRKELDGITAVRRRGPPLGSLALRWHRSSPQKARSGQTAGRVCATFKAHTKKNIQKTFAQRQGTTSLTHSNEERNTIRGRVAPSSQRQHTTFTMSSRVINPNKETAHDAVKCVSPDGPVRRNLGWRSAGKRARPASDATLARKIGQRCASRRVQTCNNLDKRKSRTAESDRVCSQWLKKTGARGTKSTTRCIHGCLLRPRELSSGSVPDDDTPELRLHPRRAHVRTC